VKFALSLLALQVLAGALPEQKKPAQKPPDPAALVEALGAADGWTRAGRAERARILEQLAQVPPLATKDVTKWKAALKKSLAKGPKLERKGGRHYLVEKPEPRGLYIVGGEDKNPKALLIAMHGGGAGSGDASSAAGAYEGAASKLGWLMIAPEVLEKTEHGWTDAGSEEFVLQLVEYALRTWKIDPDRVFFSGHSMGGYGTWMLGAHHADRVAALAASAGAPTPVIGPSGNYDDVVPGVIPNLRNVPFVIYQSDDDPQVPPAANRMAAGKLGEAQKRWGGFAFEYWEVPGRAHDEAPGGMPALLAKISARVRDSRPTHVVWQPVLDWKPQFYWLRWEHPRRDALVEAQADRAKNEIRIRGDAKPEKFEVLLDERLVDLGREVVILLNDKEVFRGLPELRLATLAKTALAGDEELVFPASVELAP
jgi:poly(3-hydroxybutyrate) depolymerase